MMETKAVLYNRFDGGLVTKEKPWLLAANQSPDISNVDIDASPGILKKRKGYSRFGYTLGTGNIHKLSVYRQSTGTDPQIQTMCAYDNGTSVVVYYYNTATWTAIVQTNTITSTPATTYYNVDFATMGDKIYWVDGQNDYLQKWTGSAISRISFDAYSFLTIYQNRMFALSSGQYPSRVRYSDIDDADDWTTASVTGYFDVNKDDGDYINGYAVMQDRMYIFKRWATYILTGSTPTTFKVRIINDAIGCMNPDTVVVADNNVIFMSYNGVYMITPDNQLVQVSEHITPTLDAIPLANRYKMKATVWKNQYVLAYTTTVGGTNDSVLCLNYKLGAWVKYSNMAVNCLYFDETTDALLFGSSEYGVVYNMNTSNTDVRINTATTITSGINIHWESPAMDYGVFDRDKNQKKAYMSYMQSSATCTMTVDYKKDMLTASDPTVLVAPASATNSMTVTKIDFPQGANGKYISLIVDETSTNDFEIYEISSYADIQQLR